MTIHTDAGAQKLICGGTVHHFINQNALTTALKFKDIKATHRCGECAFRDLCPLLDRPATSSINVSAFTGMPIGVLPIIRETRLFIEVETKKGQLMRFDRKTGVQTNCSNSRFANRVNTKDIPPYNPSKEKAE